LNEIAALRKRYSQCQKIPCLKYSDNNNRTKVLITGATGNIGIEVLSALKKLDHQLEIYAGVREKEYYNNKLLNFNIKTINFDFVNIETFLPALSDFDVLFLLRPPQISDVKKYF